jgi:hypothetical protein
MSAVNAILPTPGKPAIVLAAVQGEALARRPIGRSGPPLRAPAGSIPVGTKE